MNKEKLNRRRMQEAEKYEKKGNHNRALDLYEHILRLEPDHEQALLHRFKCLMALKSDSGMLSEGDALVHALPNSGEAWMCHGLACSHAGEMVTAESAYRRCIELEPENFRAIHNLGSVLYETGKTAEGLEYIKKSVEIRPDYQIGYATLLMVYSQEQKYTDAIAAGEKAPDFIVQRPDLQRLMAEGYYQCGDFSKAGSLYSGLIQDIMKQFGDLLPKIPLVLEKDNYNHKGTYIGDDIDYLTATYHQAVFTLITHKLDEDEDIRRVKVDLNAVINKNTEHAYALAAMAEVSKREKKPDEGLSWVEKAALFIPDNLDLLLLKAGLLIDLRNFEEAHQIYSGILHLTPDNVNALLGDALALNGLDKRDEALKLMQVIAQKNPAFMERLMGINTTKRPAHDDMGSDGSGQFKQPQLLKVRERIKPDGQSRWESD